MEERARCCMGFMHVVKKGDTLYKLGKEYGVTVSALLFANPYINVYNLQVGDELCIPKIRPMVMPVPMSVTNEIQSPNKIDKNGMF
ncbi:MAG: LysM domain-containing protein [Blautia sp.]|nr:LysM domain-containing protein [Blautia sp.]MDY4515211.1 LysM domain-containing protein [Lachnospiraceae bacterium]